LFFVGLDLGQREDFTAIAVVEREQKAWGIQGGLMVRYLERMPLGTSYLRVVERVGAMLRHPEMAGRSRLAVDATGVGAPVVEMLGSAGLAPVMTAVTITSGAQAHGRGASWNVPRKDLLMGLEVLLERGELTISRRIAEAERLVRELTSMRARGDSREHDDLVMAVGLACWRARAAKSGFGTRRLPGI
jgi:hypothetical protein